MKNIMSVVVSVCAMSFVGCVSYTGLSESGDDLVDEANQAYASEAQKAYVARMKAPPRPVVIKEAPEMNLFLTKTSGVNPLCQDLAVRKELVVAFKSQLRDKVSGIKDFKLVEENAPMVAVVAEGEAQAPQNYLMTYNIISIEMREKAMGSTMPTKKKKHEKVTQPVANQKFCEAIAKVEVRLFKPNGTESIFSFTGDGVYGRMVDAYSPPSKDLLLAAVKIAADNAMEGYVVKFGPPIFVTDTCQNGKFARLSVGSKFGVRHEQKVEFYRNKVRTSPTGEEEVARQIVGTGVIGKAGGFWGYGKAPVEDDGAWVGIEGYDEKNRAVFRWTSARILPPEKD